MRTGRLAVAADAGKSCGSRRDRRRCCRPSHGSSSAMLAIFRLREPDEHASLRGYSASSGNAMSGLSWRIDGARKSPPW